MESAQTIAHRVVANNVKYMELMCPDKLNVKKEVAKWCAPQPGMLKFNTDGAFVPGQDHAAWGVVVRDHSGMWWLAKPFEWILLLAHLQ